VQRLGVAALLAADSDRPLDHDHGEPRDREQTREDHGRGREDAAAL
jgi:hypothetical protein